MARRVRLGVAGLGRMGRLHAENLSGTPSAELVRVVDAVEEAARATGERLGVAWSTDYEDLLRDPELDAVVLVTPTSFHAEMIERAAAAGKHVFCEKPGALDLATMDQVLREVERAGITAQIGFQRRFDGGYRAAHDAVAAGALGTLLVVRAATHDPAPPTKEYIAASGGIFRDLHIHDFDAVRFVTGQEVVEVYADGAVLQTEWFAQHADVDTAVAVLRLSGGALGILSGTRHDPLGYDVRLEVFGTGDSIAVGLDARSPLRSVEPGVAHSESPGYANFMERFEPAYRSELAAFVATVRAGGASPCTLEEARAALLVALAADRSRAERRPVSIEEVGLAQSPSAG
jgi:myo-inositol 2-dehydrogenase/D-chiro-inositol 1-dehydrogenase